MSPVSFLVVLMTALCFLPYPGVPVGNVTGLQMVFFLTPPVFLYAVMQRETVRSLVAFIAIFGSYCLGGIIALLNGVTIIPTNTFKAAPVFALSVMPMVAMAPFFQRKYVGKIIGTATVMIFLHGVLGIVQWFAFPRGVFPLMSWFNNNSFQLADEALGRPMGFFPEPSTMAAVVGPFLVLLIVLVLDRRSPLVTSYLQKALFAIAALTGVALMALSKTGFVIPFAVIIGSVVALGLPGWSSSGLVSRIFVYGLMGVFLAAVGMFVWDVIEERFNLELTLSGSWAGRLDSIIEAIRIWTSSTEFFLAGVGSNQGHLQMERTGTYQTYFGMTRFGAVYSVNFTLILEGGMLAVVGLAVVAYLCSKAIRRSGYAVCGYAVGASWLAAVTFTTSYFILPGLWICLGLLLNWDRLFPVDDRQPVRTLRNGG